MQLREKVLQIAAQELGTKQGIYVDSRCSDLFDSLDFVSFLMRLKDEIGPICTEDALKAETLGDVISFYDSVPNRAVV
jgi:acyl carrier protein